MINHPEKHKKNWGVEEWIVNNELYCGKILKLKKGYQCSYHCHKIKTETFYILKGTVRMRIGDSEGTIRRGVGGDEVKIFKMFEGESIDIPIGMYHSFTGLTDVDILEISTQHFNDDSYRLTKSGKAEY